MVFPSLFVSILLMTSLGSVPSAAAQSTLHMQRLRFNLPEVTAYITLAEEDGAPIMGKAAGDFKLQLDGEKMESARKLTRFVQAKEPILVVAVVQLAATMDVKVEDLRRDVRQLAQSVAAVPESRMGLVGTAVTVKHLAKMEPRESVLSALTKLEVEPRSPDVQILDALRLAIDTLRMEKAGARKLIVLFSDGQESAYRKGDFVNVGEHAEQAGIVIDTICYGSADSGPLRKISELSKRSHGVERYIHSAAESSRKLADLTHEINEQYVVTFNPTLSEPRHRFQVLLMGQKPAHGHIVEAQIPTGGNPSVQPQPKSRDRWRWGLGAGMLLLLAAFSLGRRFLGRRGQ